MDIFNTVGRLVLLVLLHGTISDGTRVGYTPIICAPLELIFLSSYEFFK